MLKIISSKEAARKTIKEQLKREIPLVNEVIQEAMDDGENYTYYDGEISKPTYKMLKKAGYDVKNWNVWDARTEISWSHTYHKLCDDDAKVEESAKELGLDIVEMQ